jgi:hypothetical protein
MPAASRETVKLSARIPAEHYHAMQVAVQSANVAFETTTDVLRHLIEAGLPAIAAAANDPDLTAAVANVNASRDLHRLESFQRSEQMVSSLSTTMRDALRSGDQRWIGEVRVAVQHFAATTPYSTLASKVTDIL